MSDKDPLEGTQKGTEGDEDDVETQPQPKYTEDDLQGLKKNRDDALREAKDAKRRAKEAEQKAQEAEQARIEREGTVEEVKQSYEDKLTTLQQERDQLEQRYRDREFSLQFHDAAQVLPVNTKGLKPLAAYVRANHSVEVEDGAVTIDGKPVKDFLERFLESDDGSFFKSYGNAGGGAETPAGTPGGHGKKRLKDMTNEEANALFAEDRAEYYARLRAEGG